MPVIFFLNLDRIMMAMGVELELNLFYGGTWRNKSIFSFLSTLFNFASGVKTNPKIDDLF